MSYFPFLHFFCLIAYTHLAFFVFFKAPKSLLNRTCSILMLCFALWNFSDIVLHNPVNTITKDTAIMLQNISSIGWIGFGSAILCFALAFSKREIFLNKKWFLFLIIILPLFFIYKQWTNCMIGNPVRASYGWSYSWADTIWSYLFYVYYFLFSLLSIYIVYSHGRKTKKTIEKKQSVIITASILASLITGTIFDVGIPALGISDVPSIGNLFVFVFAGAVFYSIIKYNFLTITPAVAAENIISAMDEFLILLNQEGNILTANKATLESLGYDQKELEGKSIEILFMKDSSKNFMLEKIITGETIKNHEADFQTKNREKIPVIYSTSPLKKGEKNISGIVFIARDITERKRAENEKETLQNTLNKKLMAEIWERQKTEVELIKSKEAAEKANKAKSDFLANMSHEIRTPLNAIIGLTDLLEEEENEPNKIDMLKLIKQSGNSLLEVINSILDHSQIESGKIKIFKEKINIIDIMTLTLKTFNNMANVKELYITSDISSEISENKYLLGDEFKLKQILLNLISNAIKFTEEGGITLKVNLKEKAGDKVVIEFTIKDTGIGIAENMLGKIFDRFMQIEDYLTKKYKGTGLGLTIVNDLIKLMGGTLEVKSQLKKGSEFIFSIPFEIDQTGGALDDEPQQKVNIDRNDFSGIKILVAEDDPVNQIFIKKILKKNNIAIELAENGEEALRKLNEDSFDMILMDVMMPEMDGLTATKKIREGETGSSNISIPIVALTAHAMKEQHIEFINIGMDYVMVKPIDAKELLLLIKKICRPDN